MQTSQEIATPRARVIVADDAVALAKLAAEYFVAAAREAIAARGVFSVALSGGSTPKALFALLAGAPYKDRVDWSKAHFFWGDERNVPLDNADSNQLMAHTAFLDKLPIPAGNIHGPVTDPLAPDAVAAQYAAQIRAFFKIGESALPQFDLILLGLGDDGHTASLFPHSPGLKADDKRVFIANPVEKLNTTRLTLTAGAINNARSVIFLVSGSAKANVLAKVFTGPLQPDEYPSQRIQLAAPNQVTVLADRDAAAKLR